MNKKSIKWKMIIAGVFLIVFAAFLVVNTIGLIPASIPIFKVALSLFMLFILVNGCIRLSFFEIIMPLSVVACLFRKELMIEAIPYWMIILVAALVSLGATLIKRSIIGRKKAIYINNGNETIIDDGNFNQSEDFESSTSEANVVIQGSVGDQTHYINADTFETAKILGGVGDISLYFVGTTLPKSDAYLSLRGGVGDLRVHVPASWRAVTNGKPGMGDIKVHGTPSSAPEAPLLHIDVVGGVGDIMIYFE